MTSRIPAAEPLTLSKLSGVEATVGVDIANAAAATESALLMATSLLDVTRKVFIQDGWPWGPFIIGT